MTLGALLPFAIYFVATAAVAYVLGRAFAGRGWWRTVATGRGLVAGFLLSAVSVAVVALLAPSGRRATLAFTLTGVAAVYIGFALLDRRAGRLSIEAVWALATLGTALLGFSMSPVWLAVGFGAHAVWDVGHHVPIKLIDTRGVPGWYPPLCLVFDVPLGAAALLLS